MNSRNESIYPSTKSLYKYFSLYQSGYFCGVSDPFNLLACYFSYLYTTKENILELGIGNGAFLYCLANGINAPQSFGVDHFDAPFGFPAEKFVTESYALLDNLLGQNSQVTLHNCDTKKLLSLEPISKKRFSLIHIDADHSADSVISDAQNASCFLSNDGLLVFDDIHLKTVETGINTWLQHDQTFKKIFRFNNKIYISRADHFDKWTVAFTHFINILELNMISEDDYNACYFNSIKIYLGTHKEDRFGPIYNDWLSFLEKYNRKSESTKSNDVST